jgi:hypothetical protein
MADERDFCGAKKDAGCSIKGWPLDRNTNAMLKKKGHEECAIDTYNADNWLWLVGWLVAAIYRCFFLLICGNLFFCAEILRCLMLLIKWLCTHLHAK